MKRILQNTTIFALLAAGGLAWGQSPAGPWSAPRVSGMAASGYSPGGQPAAPPTSGYPLYGAPAGAGYPLVASRPEPLFGPPPLTPTAVQTLPAPSVPPQAAYYTAQAAPAVPAWSSAAPAAPTSTPMPVHPAAGPLVPAHHQGVSSGVAAYPGYTATAMNPSASGYGAAPLIGPAMVVPQGAPAPTYSHGRTSPMVAYAQPTPASSEPLPAPPAGAMPGSGTLPSADSVAPFVPTPAPTSPGYAPYSPPAPAVPPYGAPPQGLPPGSMGPAPAPQVPYQYAPAPTGNYQSMPYSGAGPMSYSLPPLTGSNSGLLSSNSGCGCALDGGCHGGCDVCDDCCCMKTSKWFASLAGLYMTRDNPNNVMLTTLAADPAVSLLGTSDAGFEWYGGFEARIGRMFGQELAVEGVYSWLDEFDEGHTVFSPAGGLNTRLDFGNLANDGVLYTTIFDNSSVQQVRRTNEFHNIEVNLLHQPTINACSAFGFTSFLGARYFRFDEGLLYGASAAGSDLGFNANSAYYDVRVLNQLIGGQFGVRGHWYATRWLRLHATPRMGVFANVVDHHTRLYRGDGVSAIDLYHEKTDIALVGQIDLGTTIYLGRVWSLFATYRAMAVGGVALADDQIPRSLVDFGDITQTDTAGSLILHGGIFGVQAVF